MPIEVGSDADFVVSLLRAKLAENLRKELQPFADRVVEDIIDKTVASLEVDIQQYRTSGLDMTELWSVKVERRRANNP